jgi:RNAse (barnase) inhibitor barstar
MTDASAEPCDKLPLQTVRALRGIEREALRTWASRRSQRLIEVALDGCSGKSEVLQAIARAFELPSWFGMNLDALYDSLTDLPDIGAAAGYVVLLDRLSRVRSLDREQRAALLAVFRDAADTYVQRRIPFRVLYS